MTLKWRWIRKSVLLVVIAASICSRGVTQQKTAETFQMQISLPAPTIHVGDDLVIKLVTFNSTGNIVYAGEGCGHGIAVELLDSKGEDIGLHAMGGAGNCTDSDVVLGPNKEAIGPGVRIPFTLQFKPEPGYVIAGVYNLRVHRRDVGSGVEVYSKSVRLTVIP
ncbi:MAG: hypothetical protein ABSD59_14515 [Terracidiphilus sp.]|jgi:hypothetical protein